MACDAFVFASETETQGLVLLEAMALGTPFVSTTALGTHDILDAGRGALVAEPCVNNFADKVKRLLLNPALRQQLGKAGRVYAKQWDTETMTRRLIDLYNDVMQDKGRLLCQR